MRGLTMNRHSNFWARPLIHLLQFITARMAGNVNQRIRAIEDNIDTEFDQGILDIDDLALIAGDRAGREDDLVARCERGISVLVPRQLAERRARFTLRAGTDDHQFVALDAFELVLRQKRRDAVEIAKLA